MNTLTTERLTLRPPCPADVPALTEFYRSERSQYAGGHVPHAKAWSNAVAMLGHWQVRGYGLWAVTETGDDRALGLVGPYYPDGRPETELGWVLFAAAEGRGIAQEAALAARADARSRLGWSEIVSYIDARNTRSIALAERLGARLDETAPQPKPDDPCLVFRHPSDVEGTA
ncbi:GNAT family N-acetyltransferase [Dinoroseobacter sp. S124A]|uniref:GNAT family N-acetyltransferase n=1 Tax=Dinoroseobacter sp. S124A TaxID=3415128 RepID=UPI003C7976B4